MQSSGQQEFAKLWTTDLDKVERHSKTGVHIPNTVGCMTHSNSPGRKVCCTNESALSSIPTPANFEAKVSAGQSVGVHVPSETARRKKEKPVSKNFKKLPEEKTSLALTQRRKSMLWALGDKSHFGPHWRKNQSSQHARVHLKRLWHPQKPFSGMP